MNGSPPGIWWKACWMFISPCLILAILISSFITITREHLSYDAWTRNVSDFFFKSQYILICTFNLRGCLYVGEPARVPVGELAHFAEMLSSRVYMRHLESGWSHCYSSNIFHKSEIRTFVGNFHDYNPQNRYLIKIKIY